MRVLVEPSDYIIRNTGDTAMLEVALTRISAMWPSATIRVFTDVPDTFPSFGRNVIPLDSSGRRIWFDAPIFQPFLPRNTPGFMKGSLQTSERFLKRYSPAVAYAFLRMSLRRQGRPVKELDAFFEAVSGADLIIANGMGGISDAFPEYASELLDVFRLALHHGAKSAMVGQGLGPLEDPDLRALARSVLPRIDFISMREEKTGAPLLRELHVSPDRVMTTGDDAIEPAFVMHPDEPGTGIGINLRAADYADVNRRLTDELRPILHRAAKSLNAPLIPIPISRVPGEEDADTIRQLMIGYDDDSDGGAALDTACKVIEQVHRCRVVIAGSYHAAVFALSSGIPAIGLAKSTYYVGKFEGLADQFGSGCAVVLLNDPDLSVVLTEAIEQAWQDAEQIRRQLLTAAARQVDLSHQAYRRVSRLADQQATHDRAESVHAAHGNPLISVVITFLNEDRFLAEAVESVLAQTYDRWELLLVDDGSSDGSTQLAREYASTHSRKIRYLEHDGHENRGMSASRNLGVKHANGAYIAFLDADDVWLPQKLARQIFLLLEHPEADMVYGPTKLWHSWTGRPEDAIRDDWRGPGVRPGRLYEPPKLLIDFLKRKAITPATCSVLMSRDVIEKVGGFEERFRGLYEDQAFFAKTFLAASAFVTSESWDLYRQHPDSMCMVAMEAGEYDGEKPHPAHRAFLEWLESYLSEHVEDDARALRLLRRELWYYQNPAKQRVVVRFRVVSDAVKGFLWEPVLSRLFQIGRTILPAPLRRRLWSRYLRRYLETDRT